MHPTKDLELWKTNEGYYSILLWKNENNAAPDLTLMMSNNKMVLILEGLDLYDRE